MEISSDQCSCWELEAWSQTCVVGVLPGEGVGEVGRATSGDLRAPVSAPVTSSVSMARPDIVTTTAHVVDDSISVDADTCSSASLDHITKFLS